MKNITPELREHYKKLWETCVVTKKPEYELNMINKNRDRYEEVSQKTGVPWYVIGCIHALEASFSFSSHLHNGDPLSSKTTHVPSGRPLTGNPPYDWEESAIDAINMKLPYDDFDSVEGMLYWGEQYNGLGYMLYHKECLSPYIWSFTNKYSLGKYTADGKFNPSAISKQAGVASMLKYLIPFQQSAIITPISAKPEVVATVDSVNDAWANLGK